jgi:hypothetical protein
MNPNALETKGLAFRVNTESSPELSERRAVRCYPSRGWRSESPSTFSVPNHVIERFPVDSNEFMESDRIRAASGRSDRLELSID